MQRDIVLENRSTGFDLGVQGSIGSIEDKFKAQDWDGAKVAFETSVRDFKDQGGGTFFNNIVEPYVMMCLEYGRPDQADEGLHFTEERMPLDSQSLIAMEFQKLKDEVKWRRTLFRRWTSGWGSWTTGIMRRPTAMDRRRSGILGLRMNSWRG